MDARERDRYGAFLSERRRELAERIASAATRSGRDASEVTLLAVSKTVGVEEVLIAHSVGYRVFGENRPQELKRKVAELESYHEMDDARFDMIGNLQKNKINQVLGARPQNRASIRARCFRSASWRKKASGCASKV